MQIWLQNLALSPGQNVTWLPYMTSIELRTKPRWLRNGRNLKELTDFCCVFVCLFVCLFFLEGGRLMRSVVYCQPQCFKRIEWQIRHFLCHLKSGFCHSKLKSGYICANTFAIFLVKFVRQRQDSKRFIALIRVAVPKQSSLSKKSLFKDLLSYRTSQAKDIH